MRRREALGGIRGWEVPDRCPGREAGWGVFSCDVRRRLVVKGDIEGVVEGEGEGRA